MFRWCGGGEREIYNGEPVGPRGTIITNRFVDRVRFAHTDPALLVPVTGLTSLASRSSVISGFFTLP